MGIKVYGSMFSTATLRVLLCLAEKDLDFELINVDLASGEHKQPHMLSRSPFGHIPAFEDGDIKLFDSRAITQYISRTYAGKGTTLINNEPKKAAMESVWMEVESHEFDPIATKLAWELCMKRFLFGQNGDEVVVSAEKKKLERVLDVYEARLSESKYLGADCFSLADMHHAPMIKLLMDTQIKEVFDARPHTVDSTTILMAITVYGSMVSTATLRVLLCLAEKDLNFELINVDLASGEHRRPHIVSRNPFGQIPAFEDGDITLFESRAISQYLSRTYAGKGTELINTDPKKAAMESVWMDVESQKLEPAATKLLWELCMKRFLFSQNGDDEVVNVEKKKLESLLDVYEARLSESKYLGGDSFSLADMHNIPTIKFLMGTQMKEVFNARPCVSAWFANIMSRPACVKVFGVPAY
ncbi:hypothetical protein M8C21_023574 [Ambrosia artemisiifolia]|uniref:glutathione transferase n=1 Tax=Ambrosia artemisiifolia TaxID=4212 RepID=A0AAD5D699_AMBAR|nr:hypothetical protein M8C21_023574 [Ambrosia artemisiifolia]